MEERANLEKRLGVREFLLVTRDDGDVRAVLDE
jgi:hypothetical protein